MPFHWTVACEYLSAVKVEDMEDRWAYKDDGSGLWCLTDGDGIDTLGWALVQRGETSEGEVYSEWCQNPRVRDDEQPEGWDPNPADRQEVTRD